MSATPPDIYEEDELLAKAARMREGLAGQARTARSALIRTTDSALAREVPFMAGVWYWPRHGSPDGHRRPLRPDARAGDDGWNANYYRRRGLNLSGSRA